MVVDRKRHHMLVTMNNDIICFDSLEEAYEMDDFFGQVVEYSHNPVGAVENSFKDLLMLDVFLFCAKQLHILAGSIQENLLQDSHNKQLNGHAGQDKTLSMVDKRCFWKQV